jgi:hypothetical protein
MGCTGCCCGGCVFVGAAVAVGAAVLAVGLPAAVHSWDAQRCAHACIADTPPSTDAPHIRPRRVSTSSPPCRLPVVSLGVHSRARPRHRACRVVRGRRPRPRSPRAADAASDALHLERSRRRTLRRGTHSRRSNSDLIAELDHGSVLTATVDRTLWPDKGTCSPCCAVCSRPVSARPPVRPNRLRRQRV